MLQKTNSNNYYLCFKIIISQCSIAMAEYIYIISKNINVEKLIINILMLLNLM